MALPLNQLEALSEAHAGLKQKKEELDEKLLEARFDSEVERLTEKYFKEAEKEIMDAVRNGKKETGVYVYEPDSSSFYSIYKKMDYLNNMPVAKRIEKELKKQGFTVTLDERSACTYVDICWENFHPNAEYEQPNFEEELKKLNDKIIRLTALNKQADEIIAE